MSKKKDSFKPWLSMPNITRSVTVPLTRAFTSRLTNLLSFNLSDLDPYYYFDPSSLSAGPVTSWNGQFVGSDNDANLTITQSTSADQPTAAGAVVTFNDNTDHLDVPSGFVEPADGSWQVVGTSLGTFAYKVNANAVSELNLLGNLGGTAHRKSGDLYGIILLPSSATAQDIQGSRKLLIDKGAGDGVVISAANAWRGRTDIVQFDGGDMSGVTNVQAAWYSCNSLTSFTSDLPSANSVIYAWYGCTSITSFSSDLSSVTSASNAWRICSSLTSFSSDLPLVANVEYAWNNCSSLTSFSSDLASATNATNAWRDCSSLTSFSSDLPSLTNASNAWLGCSSLTSFSSDLPSVILASFAWYGCNSLTSFSSDLASATNVGYAWRGCSSLPSFSSDLPSATYAAHSWVGCTSLTDFSSAVFTNWNPSSISSGVFNLAWDGCTSLTSQSVENILTSIDSSGKYATSTGASGGSALADAGIDISYDGTTLSSSTYIAVNSLKSKGWSIIVNNVTL